ncbi:MAG: C-GCAxxG-C-C family protein [Promethearchaeota archaeon]|jgi:C_GCAxxG_C_C family probable redox protein
MNNSASSQTDINKRFEEKLIELEKSLLPLGKNIGNSCAANTLNSIIEVLELKDAKNVYFNNLAIPFSGFAHFKGNNGWNGPCGAISGALAAIGLISGGKEQINDLDVPRVYGKALKFAKRFQEEFGSVMCEDLCGFDVNIDLKQYVKTRAWENKCCNLILFAVEQVSKITRKELRQFWS